MPTRIAFGISDPLRFILGDSSFFSPIGVYSDCSFAGNYISPVGGFLFFSLLGEIQPVRIFGFPCSLLCDNIIRHLVLMDDVVAASNFFLETLFLQRLILCLLSHYLSSSLFYLLLYLHHTMHAFTYLSGGCDARNIPAFIGSFIVYTFGSSSIVDKSRYTSYNPGYSK